MSVHKIRVLPDPVLRQKAKKVSKIDASIQRVIDDMIETMKAAAGVGLAANQIGVPLKIAVIEMPGEEVIVLVNPEIVEKEGERVISEACLSVPGYQGDIKRSVAVKVKARNRKGRSIRVKGEDLLAQALEHEIDHLSGIVYIDRLEEPNKLRTVEPESDEEGL
ncbi:MAG TPA: peptide deformylase [Dehalococcoidia bacterium]|jgi:peptide deformylase